MLGVCPPIGPPYTVVESSPTIIGRVAAQEVAAERLLKIVAEQQTTIDHMRKQVDLIAKDNALLVQSVAAIATALAANRGESIEGFSGTGR